MAADATSLSPTWREWTGVGLLALPLFMMAADFTAMFLVIPSLTADLAPSTTQTLWITHIGEFVAAGLVITMGWLTGRIGARTLLLSAMVIYGLASALAAFSPNPETLLVARVGIGLAGAAASPAAIAMLRPMFPQARHFGVAFAVVMGSFAVGQALGPVIAGLLLDHLWWGSVFLVNVPVAVLVLFAGLWLFPRAADKHTDRIDMTSVVLSIAAVILVVLGLQEIAEQGWSIPYVLATVVGIGLGVWFVHRQQRLTNPLLDLSLFSIRALRISACALILVSLAFVADSFVLVQYLQIVIGVPAGQLGLMLAVPGVAAIVGTAVAAALARRYAPAPLMAAGLGVSLAGAAGLIASILLAPQATALFIAGATIVMFGITPLMLLGPQLIVTSAPVRQAGSAVAVQDVTTGIGGALGLSFMGTLALTVFGRTLGTTAPEGVSTAEVDAASQSPGGAVAVAEDIGGTSGADLLAAAQDALTWGVLAVYIAAFAIGVITILLVIRGLRGVHLPSDTDDGPGNHQP